MNIPILDLKCQYQSIKPEIDAAVRRVLESGRFILGPEVEAFEKEIAEYLGVKHAIGVASGTDALLISLMAIGIKPGDEVITTPFTFFATAGSIARLYAKPVFVDIDPRIYNIDPNKLEDLLKKSYNSKIKAIMPVHLYGQCVDMDPILELAEKYNLRVIEDAAQSLGSTYKGKQSGSLGDLGCFSFFPTKNLGAYGDGGMVVTNNGELAEKIRLLRVHGSKPKYYHSVVGLNSRLDEIQAAILNVKFNYLSKWIEQKREKANLYNKLFKESLSDKVITPFEARGNYHTYHQYTVRIKDRKRDDVRNYLKEQSIGTSVYYPLPLHLQKCFADLGYKKGDFPESEKASKEVLSLPMYPEIEEGRQREVVERLGELTRRLSNA
ncbi:MAG: DegT/DnrJ/EryC1/StrS family aminotransferase [Actinomycetota bacterium]|nr:DegT/DnrJ/EryC1/StrS family aminotransferase [Actinomycetota bacterium]